MLADWYPQSIDMSRMLTRYGETLEEMGKDEEARQSFQRAFDTIMNTYPKFPETAIFLISAGKFNVQLERPAHINECFSFAVGTRDRTAHNKELAETFSLPATSTCGTALPKTK